MDIGDEEVVKKIRDSFKVNVNESVLVDGNKNFFIFDNRGVNYENLLRIFAYYNPRIIGKYTIINGNVQIYK
jgi:hypothetical protein